MQSLRSAPSDRKAATIATAIGLSALGLLNLVYGDLLLQWQPAPKSATWRMPLAYLSGGILLVAGIGLVVPRWRGAAALLGAIWIGAWVIGLHLPVAIMAHGSVAALLGLAECSAMAFGLTVLALSPDARRYKRVVVAAFGLCAVVFGIAHFVYLDFTAAMVPDWLPAHREIAWGTGVIHALAGLCLAIGVAVPAAAWIEVSMMSSFVVLLHLPRVLAAPTDRLELTMLAIATLLTSAAWIVAASTRAELARPDPARHPASNAAALRS